MSKLREEIIKLFSPSTSVDLRPLNQNNFDLWLRCYHGESPWLIGNESASLGLPDAIASELSTLTTMELKMNATNENLKSIQSMQNVLADLDTNVEYALALGGIIMKPYLYDDGLEERVVIDYSTPDNYIILSYTPNQSIDHIVFIERKKQGSIYYTRLEEHIVSNNYIINQRVFKSNNIGYLGKEVSLSVVEEWKHLNPTSLVSDWKTGEPLFSYFKNPQANNLELGSMEGVSCFSRALSLIQDADEQYQRYLWEFEGSELAIDADVTVLKENGDLPKNEERLFRNLGFDLPDGFYKVFSPSIRETDLRNGLNDIIRKVEFKVGLAYGTLSRIDTVDKTATEIKASKQRSYATVKKIQDALDRNLKYLFKIISFWYGENEEEINFDFDDSLIIDSQSEQLIMLQEVNSGILSKEKYLEIRYKLTPDNIKYYLQPEEKEEEVIEEPFDNLEE